MKFQYCSDLHLEFGKHADYFKKNPIVPAAEILLLAGDITYLRTDFFRAPFFDYISKNWRRAYWIPGNHEYYCGIDILSYSLKEPVKIRENVLLLNNASLEIEDILIVFSTLWSKINMNYKNIIENRVSDFECIVYDSKKLDSENFNKLHREALFFLGKALKQDKRKKIVVTHHLPSHKCNHTDFAGSKINSAFVSDLDKFIENSFADIWIYGHSHKNMNEIRIGNSRLLTNQFGYLEYNEHLGFDHQKTFEL